MAEYEKRPDSGRDRMRYPVKPYNINSITYDYTHVDELRLKHHKLCTVCAIKELHTYRHIIDET